MDLRSTGCDVLGTQRTMKIHVCKIENNEFERVLKIPKISKSTDLSLFRDIN